MQTRQFLLFSVLATSLAASGPALAGSDSATNPQNFNAFYAPYYKLPDPATMNIAAKRGKNIIHSTYKYLGAESTQRAANGKPFVGNRLSCSNCHMDDGTRPNASPWVVGSYKYAAPGAFSARENINRDLPARINGCFERSLAGEALPVDSQAMQDIVAYFGFLSTGLQPGYTYKQVPGQDFPKLPNLASAANPQRGAEIYHDRCKGCHDDSGQGEWNAEQKRYDIPALWGPNSFGLMAGMGRLATAVTLVNGNMPYDEVNSLNPSTRMSPQDAWDVTAYILSKDRPYDARFLKDWSGTGPTGVPNWLLRAPDAAYDYTMPRVDGLGLASDDPRFPPMFPLAQHKYGPFQPITDALAKAKTYWGY
jgi:thiosulfate dehydrogenase